jgi:hypothetical protein
MVAAPLPLFDEALTAAQRRRLHALWRAWAGVLDLPAEKGRALRHYYVWLFSGGRSSETKALTRADAATVIVWLERMVEHARAAQAAGTAGRQGFDEQPDVPPDAAAWRALWACARSLEMDRAQLEFFIRQHYLRSGLGGLSDIRTMADLNRVLWGLKSMLRRKSPQRATAGRRIKAA